MNIEHALTKRVPAAAKLHTARSRNDQVATDMRLFFKHACGVLGEQVLGGPACPPRRRRGERRRPHPRLHAPAAGPAGPARPTTSSPGSRCSSATGPASRRSPPRRTSARSARAPSPAPRCRSTASTRPSSSASWMRRGARGSPRTRWTRSPTGTSTSSSPRPARSSACTSRGSPRTSSSGAARSSSLSRCRTRSARAAPSCRRRRTRTPASSCAGKSARLQGNLHTLLTLVKGLPLTYNRDLQEDKPPVFDSFDQAAICAEVLAGTVGGMSFNRERCAAAVADPALLATDLADYLVSRGVAFRKAHHAVGRRRRARGEEGLRDPGAFHGGGEEAASRPSATTGRRSSTSAAPSR